MIHQVKPQPSDDPFKRGKTGRSEGLGDDQKRVEKTREVDPEEKKRRKFKQHLEEKKTDEPDKKPSPYESKFYDKGPAEAIEIDKKLPESKDKDEKNANEALSKDEQKVNTFEKKEIDGKKKDEKTEPDFQAQKKPVSSNETKEVKPTESSKSLKDDKVTQKEFDYKSNTKDEDSAKKEQSQTIHAAPIVVPTEILQKASDITNELRVNMSSEISPLFEKMIGHILVMGGKEGIMQTEIILDNPEMENSVFYGSKITLEKYSTAPDSFNVRLTGNPEAVTIFNANIEILMDAFQRGRFNFRIGRIDAAYSSEKPLFRRKDKSGSKDVGGGPLEK